MQNNNIDKFLESGIKKSLKMNIEKEFTDSVMDKIFLQEKYAKEDEKTGKFVKRISYTVISIIGAASIIILLALTRPGASSDNLENTITEKYSLGVFDFIQRIYDLFGNGNPLLSILSLSGLFFVIAAYFIIDKKIFKHG